MIFRFKRAEHLPGLAPASAVVLAVILSAAVLTLWIQQGWIGNVIEAGIFVLAGVWATKIAFGGAPVQFSMLLVPLGVPIVVAGLQLVMRSTVTRWETWSALLRWGSYFAIAFVSLQTCSSDRLLVPLRRWFLYFGFVVSVVSVLQYFTSPGKVFWLFDSGYEDMVLGPFVSRDHYSAFIELVLPLALFEAFAGEQVMLSYTAMAATMVASVIAGASRAGSILVLAESAVILFLLSRGTTLEKRRGVKVAVVFLAFAALFTAVVGWTSLWERFRDPDLYQGRRQMLGSAVAMARERPWTGFGLGSFETIYPAYAKFDTGELVAHAHNDWAEWAAEGGLPMLMALLAVAVQSVRVGIRRPWSLGVACVAVHSLVDFPLQESALVFWALFLLGAAVADEQTHKQRGLVRA
jgi:hypothetical protein